MTLLQLLQRLLVELTSMIYHLRYSLSVAHSRKLVLVCLFDHRET